MLTKADIEQYFIAEKNASLFLLIAGALAITAAIILLLVLKTDFVKGIGVMLMMMGVWQVYLGYNVYSKNEHRDKRRIDAVYAFDLDPGKLTAKEIPEVSHALGAIKRFLMIEAVILVTGIVLWLKFKQSSLWGGVGVALIGTTLLMLSVEYFVYKKNETYLQKLQAFAENTR